MSRNVIPFPSRETAELFPGPTWKLERALRRLGIRRITPVTWPDGARSLGFGRFVAVRPDCPLPLRTLVTEIARMVGGARRTWPYGGDAESASAECAKAGLVADAVEALSRGRGLAHGPQSLLRSLPMLERRRVIRIARRIHEAGLKLDRPIDRGPSGGNQVRWRLRGKPGSSKRSRRS